ncbi:MAG: Txe/YoeB family addiction module toxin [Patescibacteria group bacterium]|jgi:Txe/YoeB family toxin of toxin-antitoxin system
MYEVFFSKKAISDIPKLKAANLIDKAKALENIIRDNPLKNPPPYEKLQGSAQGLYSRRINIKHRLVYQVFETEKIVKIIRMWSHYE